MSAELEKSINEIVDRRVKELYNQGFKDVTNILNELNKRIEEIELTMPESEQLSRRFLKIEKELDNYASKEDVEQQVAKTMLELMPQFKTKISNEIKEHLVALAEFVIENFKEKE